MQLQSDDLILESSGYATGDSVTDKYLRGQHTGGNSSVQLFHNDVERLLTTDYGVKITNDIVMPNADATITMGDTNKTIHWAQL